MKTLVTAALPYVHGMPHLGNVTALLPADVYSRYLRLKGEKTIFICGSDSHGTMFEVVAEKLGVTPRELVYRSHKEVEEMFHSLNFKFDHYGITDHDFNRETTHFFFSRLKERGFIIEKDEKNPYCRNCKKFLADRWIEGKCPHCSGLGRGDQCDDCGTLLNPEELKEPYCVHCSKKDVEFRATTHLYLDLSKFDKKLKDWISKKDWSANVKNYTLGWIATGLKPRAITRDANWGFQVPGMTGKVFYVWFDAVLGYISITKEWAAKTGNRWEDWWKGQTRLVQFMGKDNVPFHSIIWPSMLMGVDDGFILPEEIVSSEYLISKSVKFSKSRGNGLTSTEAVKLRSGDYWRYCLMALYPDTKDAEFTLEIFRERVNKELIGNFGNFAYRVLSFIGSSYSGEVPNAPLSDADKHVLDEVSKKIDMASKDLDRYRFKEALSTIISISSIGNEHFQKSEPWKDKERGKSVMRTCINICKSLAIASHPFLPETSQKLWAQIGLAGNVEELKWDDAKKFDVHGKIGKVDILLKKIDDIEMEEWKGKYESNEPKAGKGGSMVSFDEFKKLDIRIAEIKKIEDIEGSDKLYRLELDIGGEKRQCVAGIKSHYPKDRLLGKKIVVIANLEPATIRGVKSDCMLLAAIDGNLPVVL
ncbi:MAG: methionine--tRNA ligase, partial [Candidatus Aenigmarchaeota archaeon]|nr:methionine--tRNA ligase [Candidatus Aenigmarchaeota archaeon]